MGGRQRRRTRFRPPWGRIAIAAVAAIGLSWLTVAVSAANALRQVRPDLAHRIMPFDARANAGLAEQASVRMAQDRAARATAAGLAREALSRDVTVVAAWRTLGLELETEGRRGDAERLIRFAERLSRRDLPTQLWLIEANVARNDIEGALAHYNIALRTSQAAADVLFPILVQAILSTAFAEGIVFFAIFLVK